jgi:hypothetical protein
MQRAPRRNPVRDEREEREHRCSAGDRRGIGRLHFEQERAQESGQEQRPEKTDTKPDDHRPRAAAEHEPQHVRRPRSASCSR